MIIKTIKHKLNNSLKIQIVFFPKDIHFFCFLENYRFCRKSGNDANSRGRRIMFFAPL